MAKTLKCLSGYHLGNFKIASPNGSEKSEMPNSGNNGDCSEMRSPPMKQKAVNAI